MSITRTMIAVAAAAALSDAAWAAPPDTGFINRSVETDGTEYRYQVYIPREYVDSEEWPVILALHGGGGRGDDGLKPTEGGLARAIRLNGSRFPAIVVFPQSPMQGLGWQDLGGRIALRALDATLEEFKTDRSRIYLTGYSQGGNGSWYLAYHHPERFAAVLVICGFVEEFIGHSTGTRYPPIAPSSPDPYAAIAMRVAPLPIWIFHGDQDPVVPVDQARGMAAALKAATAQFRYTELEGVGHNAWDPAYESEEAIAWLFQQARR